MDGNGFLTLLLASTLETEPQTLPPQPRPQLHQLLICIQALNLAQLLPPAAPPPLVNNSNLLAKYECNNK
ncbi:hypothetical protein C0J52_24101 [Blattella germanica]|nr:hypothetical protein C0J52_24101 [Blattella germanica]